MFADASDASFFASIIAASSSFETDLIGSYTSWYAFDHYVQSCIEDPSDVHA